MRLRLTPGGVTVSLALVAFCGAAAAGLAGVRLNTTPSMPRGLWISGQGPLRRGVVIAACLPDAALAARLARAGALGPGRCPGGIAPLMKPIVAVEGDVVTVTPAGLAVNGAPIPDTAAEPATVGFGALPHATFGSHRVGRGEAWLAANRVRGSLDSRYFGAVRLNGAEGPLRPLWLWDTRPGEGGR